MGATKESMTEAENACRHEWTTENKYGVRTCLGYGAEDGPEDADEFGPVDPEDRLDQENFSSNYKN